MKAQKVLHLKKFQVQKLSIVQDYIMYVKLAIQVAIDHRGSSQRIAS